MKILCDTNTPAPLARSLQGHEVVRTGDLGWQSLENGILLTDAENEGFDVLVTCDQNVPLTTEFDGSKDRARGFIDQSLAYHAASCSPDCD